MKKLTMLLATLAIAFTLSAPVFAKKRHTKKTVVSTSWNKRKKGHVVRAKKKGRQAFDSYGRAKKKGKKKGRQAFYYQFGRAKTKGKKKGQ